MQRLLVIAGSDPSAGAGLQADLKTAQAFGVYAQTVVTAVTVQDTNGVYGVETINPTAVKRQIQVALGDIGADAVKIGMLGNDAIAASVADALNQVSLPMVLDPVLASSGGRLLLDEKGIEIVKARLLPRALLVTPNWPECEALTAIRPENDQAVKKVAEAFVRLGARNLLIKGGHGRGATVRDVLIEAGGRTSIFESPRQDTRHTHGTGCVLSSAIASSLAQGKTLVESVRLAHDFVQKAIRTAPGLGSGHGPLNVVP
ncbi:MAG TPA: bifunctional hydroxymethylpyrimidine kinase/phosphomethylpyrimidine kinase [Rhizomicrobium sp.]|nr:bifunctional hydroxymethylpyrimidine kinase/phosphomethylpyrimidine kinase [Rhizomicrobium sp.]